MKFILTGKYLEVASIRGNQPHTGIDLAMPENTELRSITNGFVERILQNDKIGNGIVIKGQDGKEYIYGHLNRVDVGPGQHLTKGQEIGLSGSTGNSSGPHLHFGIKENGHFVNPTDLGPDVAAMSGGNPTFWGKIKDFFDNPGKVITDDATEKGSLLGNWLTNELHDGLLSLWQWFIANLPDIIGYTAIGAGILIILSAMTGQGILKPLGWFFGAFVVAACILGGV